MVETERHGVAELPGAEKRLAAFSNLGRRLSAAMTQREAAEILMQTADDLLGWDACNFDICSADQKNITTVLSIDTIEGRRVETPTQAGPHKPSAHAQRILEQGAQLVLRMTPTSFPASTVPF